MDLVEPEALDRFDRRMWENGQYTRQGSTYVPGPDSVTTDPVAVFTFYVDFREWQRDVEVALRVNGDGNLEAERVTEGEEPRPGGGHVRLAVTDEEGEVHRLSPKRMVGPSLIAVGYVRKRPLVPLMPSRDFPVASVEELKW